MMSARPCFWLLLAVIHLLATEGPATAAGDGSFPQRKAANAAYHKAPHIEVALIADVDAVTPGEPFLLGIHQRIESHWHTYWQNPGDSGLAPTTKWDLPRGVVVEPLQWPTPTRIRVKHLANYGYSNDVLLLIPARVAPTVTGDALKVGVDFSWLVCREECIPGKARLTLQLPLRRDGRPKPAHRELFGVFERQLPRDASLLGSRVIERGERIEITVGRLPLMPDERVVAFLPATPGVVHNAQRERIWSTAGVWRIEMAKNEYFERPSGALEGVVISQLGERRVGWRISAHFPRTTVAPTSTVKAPEPPTKGLTPEPPRRGDAPGGPSVHDLFRGWQPLDGSEVKTTAWVELLQTILFSLVAGLLLNLMPCVFPVLSIKVMHIVEQAGGERRMVRNHGLVFLAGVMLTFSALAVMLLVLRAAGSRVGWGFQLQEPIVVFVLAAVLFGVGLNLAGLFEVGESVMGVGQSQAPKSGFAGSFASGVLAVIVATPCTAPFMGAAIAYALTQPWWTTLAVFNALGVGMALPYLVLSLSPALLRRLPRPGAWMVRFKQFLAFPMFAAAAWLLWVLGNQAGRSGMFSAVIALIGLAMAGWVWGTTRELSRGRWLASLGALLLALATLYWGSVTVRADSTRFALERARLVRSEQTRRKSDPGNEAPRLRFTTRALASLLAAKKPVFLNMTADWCISCKVNERVALKRDVVQQALRQRGVSYMVGDWTTRDAMITEVLEHFKRNGVPLYLVLQPKTKRYIILPQVLTPSIVVEALHKL